MPRRLQALILVSSIMWVGGASALAQQPQTDVQQAGSGLAPSVASFPNLSIASGNVLCSNATVTYAGGQVTTLQNGVNYVYFDCGTSVPKSSTSPFTGGQIPLAVVVALSSSYGASGLLDVRPWAVARTEPTTTGPVSALNVAGTTGLTWTYGATPNSGLVTIGTPGTTTTGGSLYVNTPSYSSLYQSGLGIDGTYGTPSLTSIINIKALGVQSANFGSQLAFWTTNGTALNPQMTIDKAGDVGIGTTSPALQLQVAKAMGSGLNPVTVTGGGSYTADASLGNTQQITLGPSVTSAPSLSNAQQGEWLNFIVCQNGTGGYTFLWPSNVKGGTNAIPYAANGCAQQAFVYDGSNAVALGPATPVPADLTGQVGNIGATTLFKPVASGVFRISVYTVVTRAAGASSTLPSVTISWTDPGNSTSQSVVATSTNTGNSLTTLGQATVVISAKVGYAVTYSTSGYTSMGSPTMQYSLRIRAESE